jgi:hypothetical protein
VLGILSLSAGWGGNNIQYDNGPKDGQNSSMLIPINAMYYVDKRSMHQSQMEY